MRGRSLRLIILRRRARRSTFGPASAAATGVHTSAAAIVTSPATHRARSTAIIPEATATAAAAIVTSTGTGRTGSTPEAAACSASCTTTATEAATTGTAAAIVASAATAAAIVASATTPIIAVTVAVAFAATTGGRYKNRDPLFWGIDFLIARAEAKAAERLAALDFFIFTDFEHLESLDRRPNRVDRIVVAKRLGQHILDPGGFENGPHPTTGDHTGTGRSRPQQYHAGTVLDRNFVRDRAAFDQRNLDEVLLGIIAAFADRVRHFFGLANTGPNVTGAISNYYHRAKAGSTATFYGLGDPVDLNYSIFQV